MLTIHKYPLAITAKQSIMLPKQATILKFDNQFEIPVIWALVDSEAEYEKADFRMFGTGHQIPTGVGLSYIGSAQLQGGEFVWHLFRA